MILGCAEHIEPGATSTAELSRHVELPWLATDQIPTERLGDWQATRVEAQHTAFLQYTSGSTSSPRGVIVSHRNLISNAALIRQAFGTTADSSAVFWLPLFHDMGLIGGVIQPVYCGGTCTLLAPVAFLQRPALWLDTISRMRAEISGGPDFAFALCARKVSEEERKALDLSSWQVAFTGAERIRSSTLEQFAETFAPCGFRRESFFPCYGLAEATLMVSGGPRDVPPTVVHAAASALEQQIVEDAPPGDAHACSLVGSGARIPGQRVVIVAPEERKACPDGRVGEIWVQGPCVAAGYYGQPEATRKVFGARLASTGEGPFLRTGDLGFLRDGQLFVTGRLKDLIIVRARNYYPEDIELAVEAAHPGFWAGHGVAFSVEVKGEERLVIVQEIEPRTRSLDGDAAFQAVRRAVSTAHDLEVYAIVLAKAGTIPTTTSGKRCRGACRDLFLRNGLEVHAKWVAGLHDKKSPPLVPQRLQSVGQPTAKEIESWLKQRIAAQMRVPALEVQVNKPFMELGMGSLDAVEVATDLEAWLQRELSPTAIFNHPNIVSLATWLANPDSVSEDQTVASPLPALPITTFDSSQLLREIQQMSHAEIEASLRQEMANQRR